MNQQVKRRSQAWFTASSMFMVEQIEDYFMFTLGLATAQRTFKDGQRVRLKMSKTEVATIIHALSVYINYGVQSFTNFAMFIDPKNNQGAINFFHQTQNSYSVLSLSIYQNRLFFTAKKNQLSINFPLLPAFICDIYYTLVAMYNSLINDNYTIITRQQGIEVQQNIQQPVPFNYFPVPEEY